MTKNSCKHKQFLHIRLYEGFSVRDAGLSFVKLENLICDTRSLVCMALNNNLKKPHETQCYVT